MDFASVTENREPKPAPQVVATYQPLDLEAVQMGLRAAYDDGINRLVDMANAHEVTDEDSEKTAIEMAGQAKTFLKRLEEERKRNIAEPDTFVRGVNKLCKGFKDKIASIESGLKQKVGQFQWKKELDWRKREREAAEAAEKLEKQVEAEAKKAGVEAPIMPPAPVEKKETVTRTESGASAHIRTEWKCTKVLDFAKVPDQYKILHDPTVNAAIKSGVRKIPGLQIEEVPVTVLRA